MNLLDFIPRRQRKLLRVVAIADCRNTPSGALLERIGMRREGRTSGSRESGQTSTFTPSSKTNGSERGQSSLHGVGLP